MKKELVKSIIDSYLAPTSHDTLFSENIVVLNVKNKPIIMAREDYHEMQDNWSRLLSMANVKKCVDEHKNITGDRISVAYVCNECIPNFAAMDFVKAHAKK